MVSLSNHEGRTIQPESVRVLTRGRHFPFNPIPRARRDKLSIDARIRWRKADPATWYDGELTIIQ